MADESTELVPAPRMRACIEGVLGALGVPAGDAAVVAEALVEADPVSYTHLTLPTIA